MTPAEEMRAASARIRDTSLHAVPAPWLPDADGYEVHDADGGVIAEVGALSNRELRATVSHIGIWDPAMAELVAAWLDEEADSAETAHEGTPFTSAQAQEFVYETGAGSRALDLARAINGRPEKT